MTRAEPAAPVLVRDGSLDDLPALTQIYNHYVASTNATFDVEPFTVQARREWLSHYQRAGRHRLLVATRGSRVLGYTTSSRLRPKPAYDTSVETTVYLRHDELAQGVGTLLYARLFELLADEDVHRAYAAIALPNEASVRLHRRFGFDQLGTFGDVGHKLGRYWDVGWFERHVGDPAPL